MTTVSPFDRIPAFARPLIVIALLATGLAVMWYFARYVAPREGFLSGAGKKGTAFSPPGPRGGTTSDVGKGSSAREALPNSAPAASPDKAGLVTPDSVPGGNRPEPVGTAENKRQTSPELPLAESPRKKLHTPTVVSRARGRFIETEPILFNTGQATIRDRSLQTLNALAALLIDHPEMHVSINGYTDNIGAEATNQELSINRAEAVLKYLVVQGVDRGRLEAKGWGSQEPIASNDTQLGRQSNRRIEFLVLSPR